MQPALRLVYVGDPMCSWCWGFAPVLEALSRTHGLPVDLIVGGLRPGPGSEPLDDRLRGFLRAEWTRIREVTGQPFDLGALDREDWIYDTEVADMAVVAMRRLREDLTLPFFVRVQRAFYAEAVDVTDPSAYPPLARDVGADPDAFMAALTEGTAKEEAWADFGLARQMGVTGFPTLLASDGARLLLLTHGYRPLAQVESLLAAAARRFEHPDSGTGGEQPSMGAGPD